MPSWNLRVQCQSLQAADDESLPECLSASRTLEWSQLAIRCGQFRAQGGDGDSRSIGRVARRQTPSQQRVWPVRISSDLAVLATAAGAGLAGSLIASSQALSIGAHDVVDWRLRPVSANPSKRHKTVPMVTLLTSVRGRYKNKVSNDRYVCRASRPIWMLWC